MSVNLFEAYQLGDIQLANRIVMAPMTRNRAGKNGEVSPLMLSHYEQRSSAGLIITESVPVSNNGVGYPFTPGISSDVHVSGWRQLTKQVHATGGKIFIQLQHCGRISHPSLLQDEVAPLAPSAIRPEGQAATYNGFLDFVEPREMTKLDIRAVVSEFERAAVNAKQAGFDGVEIHAANGYLIDQFLRDESNVRSDQYGGTPENRMRFLNEILDAVSKIWPANRIGVRMSPENRFNSISDSDPAVHFDYFVTRLSGRGLAYLHVLEGDMMSSASALNYHQLKQSFAGTYIANNGYTLAKAKHAIMHGSADLIAFGIPFIANPDLVRRLREDLPLADADPQTFYTGGETGYTDYPFYTQETTQQALIE